MTPLYKFAQPLQFAKTSPTQFAEFGARTKMLTNVFPCWLGCNWCWRPTIVITAATSHTAGDTRKHQQHAAKIDGDYLNIIKFFYVNLLYFAFLTCLDVGLLCSFRIFANFHSIIVCMVKYIRNTFWNGQKTATGSSSSSLQCWINVPQCVVWRHSLVAQSLCPCSAFRPLQSASTLIGLFWCPCTHSTYMSHVSL